MQIFKIVMLGLLVSLSLTFSGCQGTNSDVVGDGIIDDNVSLPSNPPSSDVNQSVVKLSIVNGNKITVTGSGETKDVYIVGFNANSSTDVVGDIAFQYPADFVNDGTDLGYVTPSKVTLVDGIAHFTYKAPADLKAREDEDYTGAVFTFYDMANPNVSIQLQVDFNSSSDYATTDPVLSALVLSQGAITVTQDKELYSLSLLAFTDQSTMDITTDITVKYPQEVLDNHIDIGYISPTIHIVDGKASFSYQGPENEAVTVAKLEAAGLGHSVLVNFFNATTGVNVDLNISFIKESEKDYSTYKLVSLPSSVTITKASQTAQVELYLEDNTSRPVANETILLDYFDGSKGTMDKFEGVTDANGHVLFRYTAPSTLPSDGNLLTMTFRGVNTTLPEAHTVIDVNRSAPLKDYSGYMLSIVDANRTITAPSQSEVFDIFLKDANNNAAEGDTITLDFFDGNSGTVNSFKAVTDANGHAVFNYTAPANLDDLNGTELTFRVENTTIAQSATLTVSQTSADAKYANYELSVLPENSFTVVEGSQKQVIDIYLEDNSTTKPVAGELVNLQFFNGAKGTMNLFSAVTDANGHAAFEYTAPSSLDDVNGTTLDLVFELDKNTSTRVTTQVVFDNTQTLKDYSGYMLSIVDANRTITAPSQSEVFDIFLKDANNNAAEGDTITLDFFDGNSGTVNSFKAVTDANGHAVFNYTAPANLDDLNGTELTFRVENTMIAQSATLTVSQTVTQKPNIHIDLPNGTLTLTRDGQAQQVRVLAFNDDNEPFENGTIVVQYPDEIVDGNISGGKFAQSEVAIVNGEADFDFVGPTPLKSMNSLNFTFVYKESSDVNTTLTVNYVPVLPTVILTQNSYELHANSEMVTIDVDVYDEHNNPYPDGNVKIIYPDDVKTGRDIGNFTESTVALENGVAHFVYTAPAKLDENTSDIIFQFYHEKNPTSPQTFTFTINPDENQTVLTNYKLYSSIADGNVTMDLNSSKLLSFFVKDSNGEFVPDSNMTAIKMTLLNATLGTLEDNNGNSGISLMIEDKNSVTVNLRSNTISGIIPIQVDANFTDANDDNQTLSSVFNVVILSGAPTAISLSYAGTEQDETNAKFIEKWILTVTDRYNNKINTNPAVSMGMLAGYAKSSAETKNAANYLYYRTFEGNGTLDGDDDTLTANSSVGASTIFGNVDQSNDYLVTFGNGYTYNASGKWNVNTDTSDTTKLDLIDDYNGTTTSGLGFAVGNNKRQDTCEDGVEYVGNVYPENGSYIIDKTGSMRLNVEYDYTLVGKDVMLWVNLVGRQNSEDKVTRIGEARKVTLRGQGLTSELYSFSKGFEGVIRLHIHIDNTVEFLKNANFGYVIEVISDDANWTESDKSMDHNITYCYGDANQSGEAYVDVNFTSETPNDGTVTLKHLLITNEF